MQYMLLLQGEEPNWEDITPEETQAMIESMNRFNNELKDAGAMVTGGGLRERATATVVRFQLEGDPIVTDGPFTETKEQLMGFWIIDCANLDEALAWTTKVPLDGGAIEVRPLVEESREEDDISGDELIQRATEKR
jgi:hypothetical protein